MSEHETVLADIFIQEVPFPFHFFEDVVLSRIMIFIRLQLGRGSLIASNEIGELSARRHGKETWKLLRCHEQSMRQLTSQMQPYKMI